MKLIIECCKNQVTLFAIATLLPDSVKKMWMRRGSALRSDSYKKAQAYPLGMLSSFCNCMDVNDCLRIGTLLLTDSGFTRRVLSILS